MPDSNPFLSLNAIARQSARASKHFGVDFVPMYRSKRHGIEVVGALEVEPEPASIPVPKAPAASSTRTPVERPRPAARAPATAVASEPVEQPATAPAPSTLPSIALVAPARPDVAWSKAQLENWDKLEEIRKRYEADAPHQHFVTDHHNIVFGDGDPCAKLMFVGEAPGADEDRVGKPFVGRAGQLLEKMINAMGLSRSGVYITNVLKTRPPNNATPTLDEARLCAPYLFDQIAVIAPTVIVTLGLPATRLLLSTDQSMGALRGRWSAFSHKGVDVAVMPTYHPAFLLRSYSKENREKVWSDLQKAMERLGFRSPRPPLSKRHGPAMN